MTEKRSYSVLLVEDNQDHLLLEKAAILRSRSVRSIEEVSTAKEAFDRAKLENYDLLIIDFNLPGTNGLELIRDLKKEGVCSAVIVLTGVGNEKIAVEAMKLGIYDYIAKEQGYLGRIPKVIETALEKYEYEKRLAAAERELREYDAKLKALVQYSPEAVYMKDLSGKFVLANSKALELIKVFRSGFFPDDFAERLSATDEKIIGTKEPAVLQAAIKADEEEIFLEISKYPVLDETGDVKYICGICRNISERKRLEKFKNNLIRDLSHELKTPISITSMAYDMCQRAIEERDFERIQKAQNMAHENIQRMYKNVENIIDMFRLSEVKNIMLPEDLDLREVITEVANDLRIYFEHKNITLDFDLPGNMKIFRANRKDMRTLVYNMVDNAAKFTEKGGVKVRLREVGGLVLIEVADTGVGIAGEDIDKVFDRFYKKHAAISGTGLGLSVCKEVAEIYNGKIEVFSEGPDKGTTVRVMLPAAQEEKGKKE